MPSDTARSGHPRIATALVALGTLLAFVAIFSIWANRQALNTDNWVNTSGRLLSNEDVDQQLSNYLAAQLFAHVDLRQELEGELPPKLAPLARPVAGGLEQLAPQIAERALQSPKFQALWEDANRVAHEQLLRVLDGDGGTVSTGNGEVTLDLGSLVTQLGEKAGVGEALAEKLPSDAAKLTILKSDQLAAAQSGAKLVRELPIVLTLLVAILFAAALWLAGPRRRRTLRAIGIGLVGAGVLVLILRGLGGDVLVSALVKRDTAKPAVEAVWTIATSLLVTVAVSTIAFGLLVVIGAWLAGPTRLATRARQAAAPYVRDRRALVWAIAAAVWLVLILLVPIAAFAKPLGILIFAVLFALATELLCRQALREFPGSRRAAPAAPGAEG